MILKYLKYLFRAKDEHGIHSPFLFNFYLDVVKDQTPFYAFKQIEKLRNELLSSNKTIEVLDLGAGMKTGNGHTHSIKKIAKSSSISPKYGQLLFRLVNYIKPKTILELGTSLGISTLYMSIPSSTTKVITMEGSPEKIKVAKGNFDKLNARNIETVEGNFNDTLSKVLAENPLIDLAFIDGNHRKEPTLKYFEQIAANTNEDSVIIFDDIHWSDEMEEAWNIIIAKQEVKLSLDLFYFGIIFFKKELSKENYVLRF
ncbi:MAG: class I SAM-dependent methyltransferase [Flavobacteriales bacterium]|nr:class I SAM-dependent methyltransferase [Flavobacteriales bacterium]